MVASNGLAYCVLDSSSYDQPGIFYSYNSDRPFLPSNQQSDI